MNDFLLEPTRLEQPGSAGGFLPREGPIQKTATVEQAARLGEGVDAKLHRHLLGRLRCCGAGEPVRAEPLDDGGLSEPSPEQKGSRPLQREARIIEVAKSAQVPEHLVAHGFGDVAPFERERELMSAAPAQRKEPEGDLHCSL